MMKTFIFTLLTFNLLFATTYPLGLNKSEWSTLSPDKKVEYIKAQKMMNEMKENQYSDIGYRDRVVVSSNGGKYKGYKENYNIEPFSVIINKGETVQKTIRMKKGNGFYTTRDCYITFDFTGNTVIVALSKPYGNKIKGTSFSNDGSWNIGKSYFRNIIDGRKEIYGITLTIRYDESLRNTQKLEIYNY